MKIEQWAIDEPIPYDRNPRKISEEAVNQVANSLSEAGWQQPIVVNKDGVIIVGHTRLKAAQKLKMDRVPVLVADLTKEQEDRYRLRDNKSGEFSMWDIEMLGIDWEAPELEELGFDLGDMGIEIEPEEGLTDEDEVPEVPEEPTAKVGDIWKLGDHRLMCGDSTDGGQVGLLMDGKKANMVFTDPPYGISYDSPSDKHDIIKNDDVFLDGWVPMVEEFSEGFIFVWTGYQVVGRWLEITKPFGDITNMVIWSKGGGGLGDLYKRFATDFEIALVWNRGAEIQGKRIGSVWDVSKDNGATYAHPTQKPVDLMKKGLENCSKRGDVVLDLFLGSGTTLIACETLGRKCSGMELDPKYIDVIIKRWEDFTGKKAELLNG